MKNCTYFLQLCCNIDFISTNYGNKMFTNAHICMNLTTHEKIWKKFKSAVSMTLPLVIVSCEISMHNLTRRDNFENKSQSAVPSSQIVRIRTWDFITFFLSVYPYVSHTWHSIAVICLIWQLQFFSLWFSALSVKLISGRSASSKKKVYSRSKEID